MSDAAHTLANEWRIIESVSMAEFIFLTQNWTLVLNFVFFSVGLETSDWTQTHENSDELRSGYQQAR